MDIGTLLDMDNLDGTIAPRLYSTLDLAATPSHTHTSSRGSDLPKSASTQLHPTTMYTNAPHEPVLWNRHAQQYTTKQWPPVEPHLYPLPQDRDIRRDWSPAADTSFQNDSESFDFSNDSNVPSENASPDHSHEEIQWQMYLTESLSGPLDSSLEFGEVPLTLSYPAEDLGGIALVDHSLEVLPSSTSSPFPLDTPNPFDSLSFIDVASPLSAGLPSGRTIVSNRSRGNIVDSASSNSKEETPRHDQSMAIPNGTYTSLMELTPPVFNFGSARFSSLEAPCSPIKTAKVPSPIHSTPPRGRSATRAIHSLQSGRGLSGWDESNFLQVPTLKSLSTRPKRRRSISTSPSAILRRPFRHSPLSSSAPSEATDSTRGSKRTRISTASTPSSGPAFDLDTEEELEFQVDDGDSDDYRPSRSASPDSLFSSFQFATSHRAVAVPPGKKKSRRGKGKAKGSAALALAVVTQLGSKSRADSEQCDSDMEALALYQDGTTRIRKRKNHPIPLPVPVPNLNKKSRGRKVPYVADLDGASQSGSTLSLGVKKEEAGGGGESGPENVLRSSGRPRRRASIPEPVVDELAGSRTYVCVVNGCGKCFVRGEHLKRHVRSIHTHDKPHPCPYEGCDKSFSRRDNLGQHVRIHLQP